MTNYNNGKIYKIEPLNGEEGDIYIGSTTKELLCQRMASHRCDYKRWKNGNDKKITSFDLFDKYGLGNCKIILIENVNAKSKDELISRESFFIKSLNCINKIIPDRKREEWVKDNIDRLKEYNNEYYEDNKEKIKEYHKEYNENNKDKKKEYNHEYRENNKDKVKKYNNEYSNANKDKIKDLMKEYRKLEYICDCGSICKRCNKAEHFKTKKHQEFISKIESSEVPL
jgi:hypothetical protein